jgi:DNA invertase Pin-like site-specific DNA recombinase
MIKQFGYSRVSTSDQDWALQLAALKKAGIEEHDVFKEKASGAKRNRLELRRVLDLLRDGDKLVVYRLDRLARSQLHLLEIIDEIESKGAKLISLNENIDTSTATGKLLLSLLGVLAQFERDLLIERTRHGMKVAKEQRGVRFGRPAKLSSAVIRQVALAHDDPEITVPEACRSLGLSKSTYYNALRKAKIEALGAA